ncbi:hypothetical protein [Pelomonas sp. Root1217]|uniref:hypothetical protein n=1 Tax=Pelomonas sp. Root1217 TaxID=1736430 RepID=UPI000B2A8E95|nr:hypothetical protein [Pelomonas sp. Root1217]
MFTELRRGAGFIPEFTGVSSRYETPLKAAPTFDTALQSVDACVAQRTTTLDRRAFG